MLFADNNDYDAHGCTNATINVDMYAQGGKITIQVDYQPYHLMAMHTVSPSRLL